MGRTQLPWCIPTLLVHKINVYYIGFKAYHLIAQTFIYHLSAWSHHSLLFYQITRLFYLCLVIVSFLLPYYISVVVLLFISLYFSLVWLGFIYLGLFFSLSIWSNDEEGHFSHCCWKMTVWKFKIFLKSQVVFWGEATH